MRFFPWGFIVCFFFGVGAAVLIMQISPDAKPAPLEIVRTGGVGQPTHRCVGEGSISDNDALPFGVGLDWQERRNPATGETFYTAYFHGDEAWLKDACAAVGWAWEVEK